MQGPETSGKNPIGRMERDRSRAAKLERFKSKLNKNKSAEDRIDSSFVTWEAIFHATKDALMVIDSHSTIIRANLATSSLFGKSLEEIIGQSCWQVAHGTNGPPKDCPLQKALASGQHEEAEFFLPEKGIWVEVAVDPIIDDQGKVNSVVHTLRDITNRKKGTEALSKSEEKHRAIFEGAMDGIVYADRKARVIDVNPAFTRITGIPREEVIGKSGFHLARRFAKPKDVPRLLKAVSLALKGKPVELYELEINNKIVEISTPSLRNEKSGITGVIRDISDRRKAKEALRESEKSFRDIFENSLIGMYRTTPDGHILMANRALVRMLGYQSFEELATRNLEQEGFVPGYPRSEFKRRIEIDGWIMGLESAWRRRDGTTLFVCESAQAIRDKVGHILYYQGTVEDVTERKKAEQALLASENRLALAIECTGLGLWDQDFQTGKITRNDNWVTMLGYKPDEIGSDRKAFYELVHPEDLHHFKKCAQSHEMGGASVFDVEHRMRAKSGQWRWIRNFGRIVKRDEQGRPLRAVGVHLDITERKEAELAVIESEKKYRDLVEASLDMIFRLDLNGRLMFTNRAWSNCTGYSPEEAIKINGFDLIHPEDLESTRKRFANVIAGKAEWGVEFRSKTKSGEYRDILVNGSPVFDAGGKVISVLGTGIDITDRKMAERKLADDAAFQSVLATIRGVSEDQSEQQMWKFFLKSLVVEYGFKMAWFGSYMDQQVRPLIWAGCPGTYLDGLVLDISEPTSPDAACAMSQCILSRNPFGYADLAHDPGFKAWRRQALDHGFGSNMALPFIVDGRVEGGIMVYAATAHGFSGERTSQLQSLVDDIAQRLGERRQREKARQALQESEQRLRSIIDHSVELFFVHDTEHNLVYVSPQCLDIFGYTPDEMRVRWTTLVSDNPINKKGFELTEKAIQTGQRQESYILEIKRKDGELRFIEIDESPIKNEDGKVVAISGALRDITERVRAEQALKESESQLKRAQEVAHVGSWYLDLRTDRLTWSDETYRIFGLPIGQPLTEADFLAIVHPDDLANVEASWAGALHGGSYDVEHRIVVGQTVKWVREKAELEFDVQNRPLFGIGTVQDITERKHTEQIIRQSEEFLNSVIENTPNPMWLSDEKGTVIRINQALRELLNVKNEEMIGQYNIFKDQQLREQGLLALVEKVFTEGQTVHFEMEYDTAKETQIRLGEHINKTLELTLSPLRNINGVITNVICQHRDITERKRAEAELREYQGKLKAMASEILQTQERERRRLAVGLHDDICQKLVLAKLTLESSLRRVSDAQLTISLKTMTETIGEMIRQVESLTFELSNPVLREFGFVAALEKHLATEIRSKHGIAYELEADEHLGFLRDEVKTCLFRVTRELLTNVVKHAQAQKVKVSARKIQNEIHITVQDDGVGFDPAKIRGEDSENVRFGLFSVREQLEHLGGFLIIESKPGKGTMATVVI